MKALTRFLLFLSLLIITSVPYTFAQGPASAVPELQKMIPPSPMAMSFIKYGNYPVDLTTGVPNISVPIYQVNSPRIKLPISANYHAGGFKPLKYMGILGLGWSLSANYMISRVVQGDADETTPFPDPFKSSNEIKPWLRPDYDYLNYLDLPGNYYEAKDSEYDIFYYNLPSGSGKFVLKNIGNNKKMPVTIPFRPIRITSNSQDFNTDFHTFEIIDEDGVMYRFGRTFDDQIDYYEETRTPRGAGTFKTGWFLASIVSADRSDTIKFKYTGTFQQKQPAEDTYILEDEFHQITQYPIVCSGCNVPQTTQTSIKRMGLSTSYYSLTVSEIRYRHGHISFSYHTPFGSNDLQLSAIQVRDRNNELMQEILPITSFYPQNAPYFKLDELQFRSQGETQKYLFDYETSHAPPPYGPLITALDHWGFYNGNTNNPTLLPDHQLLSNGVVYHTGSADRESDEDMMKVYMLKKITYPTGGTSEFEFEANRIPDGFQTNGKVIGGLRIKAIVNTSGTGNTNRKTYKYGLSGSGTGNLALNPELSRLIRYTTNAVNCGECPNYTSLVRSVSSEFTDGSGLFETSPIFYSHVTEYEGDGSGVAGKTSYFFEEPSNAYSGNPFFNYLSVMQNWTGNNLLEKHVYKKEGTGFKEVLAEINQYTKKQTEVLKGLKVIPNLTYPSNVGDVWDYAYMFGVQANIFKYADYTITSGTSLLSEKRLITNTGTDTLETLHLYTYGAQHNNPLEISTLNSKRHKTTTRIRYPSDYSIITGVSNFSKGIKLLQERNIINPAVENITTTYQEGGAVPLAVTAVLNSYKPNVPLPDAIWTFQRQGTGYAFTPSYVNNDDIIPDPQYEQEIFYSAYDAKSNILERKSKNGITEVFVWGYESTLPVAKLDNTTFNAVNSLLNIANIQSLDNELLRQELNILRTIPKCITSFYTHKPNVGITSETDATGKTTYFEYDHFQRLKLVKDHNQKILKQIQYGYAEQ